MHISEGILPLQIVAGTTGATVPFIAKGIRDIKAKVEQDPAVKPLVGLVSAAVFVISALPVPSPLAGVAAHPTAIAIAAIILGPWAAATVTGVVLMLQALLMAHGGISAWGANTLNMGVLGAWAAYAVYWLTRRGGLPLWAGLALAGALGDVVTYLATSATMAVALAGWESVVAVTLSIFALFLPSLVVLVSLEVLFTVGLFNFIRERRPDLAERMGLPGVGAASGDVKARGLSGATALVAAGLLLAGLLLVALFIPSQWEGVDVAIVQTKAEELGGQVAAPLLNITGDLQLFVFTLAGFIGGAIIGYTARGLFARPPQGQSETSPAGAGPAAASAQHGHSHPHGQARGHVHEHDEIAEVAQTDVQVLEREHALWQVSARAKVLALAVTLMANLVAGTWVTPALIFVGSVALLLRAGVPGATVVKRLLVPWYFAAVAFLMALFLGGQTVLFHVGPLTAYAEGAARGLAIGSKVVGGTAAVLAVSMTTPLTTLLATAAWLRVPPLLVEIAALTYRFLFLLAEEAERIREAQKTRLGHSSWHRAIRSYSTLGGMVVAGSYDRAERVYQAMLLRGYTGAIPVPEAERGWSTADVRALVVIGLGLSIALAAGLIL